MEVLRRLSLSMLINVLMLVLFVTNIGFISLVNYFGQKYLVITFFDIGQGDSFLIKTPDKLHMIVDGGPDDKALFFLNNELKFWEKLDLTMLSHPDSDHVGALPEIIEKHSPTKNFSNELGQPEKDRLEARAGDVYRLGCCIELSILWPLPKKLAESRQTDDTETNDNSITFMLRYGSFIMFSGGDIGQAIEEEVLSQNLQKLDHVDLLKVGHHGSKTSTSPAFISSLRPHFAVIQVGEENKYGHPAFDTLDTLRKTDTKVLRNDNDGQIKFITDGYGYRVETGN